MTSTDWHRWGPYLSERQWGTVREDYSADGAAWTSFPHDHARSRAYRWGEDGLAGFSDDQQLLCLALALWNGHDPILKERAFGLAGPEGNHGEDVKEYWWYLDAVPTHAWQRWRYHYPQRAFPYEDLVAESARRTRNDPEYKLLDTGVFDDDRYWVVEVDHAKAAPDDILTTVRVTNAAATTETLHVLPHLWFRNTWSWTAAEEPLLARSGDAQVSVPHPELGRYEWLAGPAPGGSSPELLFCSNETNQARLYGAPPGTAWPKDGINDHVLTGAPTVNPAQQGSKCAAWYRLSVGPGETVELRLRLRPAGGPPDPLGDGFASVCTDRRQEADDFHTELAPAEASADEAAVLRQAFAGLLWSKQFYAYDVSRWLDGDPAEPTPPPARRTGRNARWRSFSAGDVMSMPDTWEYPWFAAWDLAFHCVALAHIDPDFAKGQLLLLCREWFQHPSGALPAYEWDFGDVNPPVQAWAALEVFAADGGTDLDFLGRVFDKLLMNFTWWVNRQDADGSNLFEGGFLGLDNIGPIDRSHLSVPGTLEQADATGWMAFFALSMATIAAILRGSGHRPSLDLVQTFLERFADIRAALDNTGMWDEADGLCYDRITAPNGTVVPIRVRSIVAMIPMLAVATVNEAGLQEALEARKSFAALLERRGIDSADQLVEAGLLRGEEGKRDLLIGVLTPVQARQMLRVLFDPAEFLSPYGIRSMSAIYRDRPYVLEVEGFTATVDYEPAESRVPMFGGNSNWRGPVWMPMNYLLISALEQYARYFGDELDLEYPTGSGTKVSLETVVQDLWDRLIALFTVGADGRRPCYGWVDKLQHDPRWRDNITFNEYFHGDNGAGLGASHQTGWTALIAAVIRRRHGAAPGVAEILQRMAADRP